MGVLFREVSKHPTVLLIFKRRKVQDPSTPMRGSHRSQYKAYEDVRKNAVFAKDTKP